MLTQWRLHTSALADAGSLDMSGSSEHRDFPPWSIADPGVCKSNTGSTRHCVGSQFRFFAPYGHACCTCIEFPTRGRRWLGDGWCLTCPEWDRIDHVSHRLDLRRGSSRVLSSLLLHGEQRLRHRAQRRERHQHLLDWSEGRLGRRKQHVRRQRRKPRVSRFRLRNPVGARQRLHRHSHRQCRFQR